MNIFQVGSYGYSGTVARGRGGKPSESSGMARSGTGKRGMSRGGSKRAGVDYAGPASKRGGRTEDFSADVPMNMF